MKLEVIVNPQPFTSELFALIQVAFDMNIVVRLIDSYGNQVSILSAALKKGNNEIKIDKLDHCAVGKYQLEIKSPNGDLLKKVQLVKDSVLTVL